MLTQSEWLGKILRVRRKILEVREDLPRGDLDDSTCNPDAPYSSHAASMHLGLFQGVLRVTYSSEGNQ